MRKRAGWAGALVGLVALVAAGGWAFAGFGPSHGASALILHFEEEDGSPSISGLVKVSNGSLTDNLDGTISLLTGGGGGGGTLAATLALGALNGDITMDTTTGVPFAIGGTNATDFRIFDAGGASDDYVSITHDSANAQIVAGSGGLRIRGLTGTNLGGTTLAVAAGDFAAGTNAYGLFGDFSANDIFFRGANINRVNFDVLTNETRMVDAWSLAWSSAFNLTTMDVGINRDAAGVLLVNNGVTTSTPGALQAARNVETVAVAGPNVILDEETWKVFDNGGTAVEAGHNLPPAAAGLIATFVCSDADGLVVNAAAGDVIHIEGDASASAGECSSITVGSTLTLIAVNATDWFASEVTGTWLVDDVSSFPSVSLAPEHPSVNGFRLTLETGVPVSTTDQLAQTTVYLTPFASGEIYTFDSGRWEPHLSAEVSLALGTLSTATNHDVFARDVAGTLTLSLLAWTNDTTRATALVRQDGVFVQTGATERRYVGTFRTVTTTTTEDSEAKRFLWSESNRVPRPSLTVDSTANWTLAFNQATRGMNNGAAAWKHEFVLGLPDTLVSASAYYVVTTTINASGDWGFGLDSVATVSADSTNIRAFTSVQNSTRADEYRGYPGIGFHFLQLLEAGAGVSGSTTTSGSNQRASMFTEALR